MDKKIIKLPLDWVERIFDRLYTIYGERWIDFHGNPKRKDLSLSQWSTGLSGLTPEEIKKALSMCETFPHADIPTVVEFYHYAKGIRVITKPKPIEQNLGNKEVAKIYMDTIKSKLSIKRSST